MLKEKITVYGPAITYQYSLEGELDASMGGGINLEVLPEDINPDASNIPGLWQAKFLESWSLDKRDPQVVLKRLRELLSDLVEKLPDNGFALKDAWLAGLPVQSEAQAGIVTRAERIRRREAEVQAQLDAQDAELSRLKSQVELVSECRKPVTDEGGKTELVQCRLRHRQTGRIFEFTYRDVFDVGPVINPAYAVAPGLQPGGICMSENGVRYWADFKDGENSGWYKVRDLELDEVDAYLYMHQVYASDGIRM